MAKPVYAVWPSFKELKMNHYKSATGPVWEPLYEDGTESHLPKNMKDTMYRVHLRDQSFMKIQKHLQSADASVTSHDPQGKFDYTQHLDMVLKMNQ